MPKLDDAFETHRDALARLAYRILGTRADADDVMQEAYLRWTAQERSEVRSPRAYLSSLVTRLCIDRRREIDARKETYVGPWLPEPFVQPAARSAEENLEVAENVSLALMHVLEHLSPVERAAYLLRQMFDYDYEEISEILGKSVVNCRQLVSRAQERVHAERPRFETNVEEVRRISEQFLTACATGDTEGLVRLLADDVTMYSDGGGKVSAALRPLEGVDHVSRFLLGIFRKGYAKVQIVPVLVNGQPGYAVADGPTLFTVITLDIADSRVRRLYFLRNPDKLERVKI